MILPLGVVVATVEADVLVTVCAEQTSLLRGGG